MPGQVSWNWYKLCTIFRTHHWLTLDIFSLCLLCIIYFDFLYIMQWEFQVGPAVGISAGDELWVARYILEVGGTWLLLVLLYLPYPWTNFLSCRGSLRLLVWFFPLTLSQSRLTFFPWRNCMLILIKVKVFTSNVFCVIKKPGWLEWCWGSHQLQVTFVNSKYSFESIESIRNSNSSDDDNIFAARRRWEKMVGMK